MVEDAVTCMNTIGGYLMLTQQAGERTASPAVAAELPSSPQAAERQSVAGTHGNGPSARQGRCLRTFC